VLELEGEDPTLTRLRAVAAELGVWLVIGSLLLKTSDADGRFANRSFVVAPNGAILARYDKIHMFDVDLDNGESWRESATYDAGDTAIVVHGPPLPVGMAICYDLRFGDLYRSEALAGAEMLTCPACFTRQTGEAHWHALLRARAIENGAFIAAAAQGGTHEDGRQTYGHSLVYDPWGRLVGELADDEPGILVCEIDPSNSMQSRRKIPNLGHGRDFSVRIEAAGADQAELAR
jgi:predicted amidohydrolase